MVLEFVMECGDKVAVECASAEIGMLLGDIVDILVCPANAASYHMRIPEQHQIARIRMHAGAGGCVHAAQEPQEPQGGAIMC